MSRIYNLFSDVNNNSSAYLKATSGKDFERLLIIQLEKMGYKQTNFNQLGDSYKKHFKTCIEEDNNDIDNDTTYFNHHYINQPFGSQRYPDFLVLDTRYVLCLELKFSSKKTTKPVWNSGLPRANGIYIFASSGRKDITFFRGCDILRDQDRKLLKSFFDEELERSELFNKRHMSDQEFGFSTYARKAYQQIQKHNPNAITNFFDNPLRQDLEKSVIDYLKVLDKTRDYIT